MPDEDVRLADGGGEALVELNGETGFEDDDRRDTRSRIVAVLILLLLLLLCVVTTAVDTFLEKGPLTRTVVLRDVACLVCHTELIPEYARSSVHNPFLTKGCKSCHTPHGKKRETRVREAAAGIWRGEDVALEWLPLRWIFQAYEGLEALLGRDGDSRIVSSTSENVKGPVSRLVLPETELCWMCHGDLGPEKSMPHQHVPFEKGFCTNCHNPHASDFSALLIVAERDLCVTCHPVAREMARQQLHAPFEGRFCVSCHHPHASDYTGILIDNQRDLCFSCHEAIADLSIKAVQHQPFVYDNCTGCHMPHSADVVPLLVEAQPPLCYRCHPGIREDFRLPSHHPVELELGCPDCHDPHAADYEGLIVAKDNLLCYECHASAIQTTYEESAHQPQLCIVCHTPHGSVWAPMLRNSNPDICLRCHPAYEGRNRHPVRPVRDLRRAKDVEGERTGPYIADPRSNPGLSCTSDCHRPHGTMHPRMLTYAYRQDGLCLECHELAGRRF